MTIKVHHNPFDADTSAGKAWSKGLEALNASQVRQADRTATIRLTEDELQLLLQALHGRRLQLDNYVENGRTEWAGSLPWVAELHEKASLALTSIWRR